MDIKDRFFEAYEYLKKNNNIDSLQSLGNVLGTNKAGVSDLKHGRKKISIDHIVSMINSYPEISLSWLVLGKGSMIESSDRTPTELKSAESNDLNVYLELITMQKKEIARLENEIANLKTKNTQENSSN